MYPLGNLALSFYFWRSSRNFISMKLGIDNLIIQALCLQTFANLFWAKLNYCLKRMVLFFHCYFISFYFSFIDFFKKFLPTMLTMRFWWPHSLLSGSQVEVIWCTNQAPLQQLSHLNQPNVCYNTQFDPRYTITLQNKSLWNKNILFIIELLY